MVSLDERLTSSLDELETTDDGPRPFGGWFPTPRRTDQPSSEGGAGLLRMSSTTPVRRIRSALPMDESSMSEGRRAWRRLAGPGPGLSGRRARLPRKVDPESSGREAERRLAGQRFRLHRGAEFRFHGRQARFHADDELDSTDERPDSGSPDEDPWPVWADGPDPSGRGPAAHRTRSPTPVRRQRTSNPWTRARTPRTRGPIPVRRTRTSTPGEASARATGSTLSGGGPTARWTRGPIPVRRKRTSTPRTRASTPRTRGPTPVRQPTTSSPCGPPTRTLRGEEREPVG